MHCRLAGADDQVRWDSYVSQRANASPYHLMGWGLAIKKAYDHQVFFLLAEHVGQVVGVLPLCLVDPPLIGKHICSLPFCDVGGSLSDDEEVSKQLMSAAMEIANNHGVQAIEVRQRNDAQLKKHEDLGGKVSMMLPLPDSADELFEGFKAKLRSQIRKAKKNGLTCRVGNNAADIDDFYEVLSANMRDLGSPVHSKAWFKSIYENYVDSMAIAVVHKGDVPVGTGMMLMLNDLATVPWASTLARYNRLAPNMLLYWSLLEHAIDQNCTLFDFGRSTFGEGTYRFKKQWGASPVALEWLDYSIDGSAKKQVDPASAPRLRNVAEFCWKRLPLPAANLLGPQIRKYISL